MNDKNLKIISAFFSNSNNANTQSGKNRFPIIIIIYYMLLIFNDSYKILI